MLVDFGPLLVFFLVNSFAPGPALARGLAATAAFMVAISAAVAFSWWKTRHVSVMLWLSGVMVLLFGGLTIYFHNLNFIQAKPTIYYLLLSFALTYGLAADKPLLEALLGTAYPGLSARGWRLMTISWAAFFAVMGALNTIVWLTQTYDFWNWYKVWRRSR
ncbi:MAG: septation protein IspZ [Sphingomonas sp.]